MSKVVLNGKEVTPVKKKKLSDEMTPIEIKNLLEKRLKEVLKNKKQETRYE